MTLADLMRNLFNTTPQRSNPPSGVLLVSAGGLGDTVLFSLVLPRFAALARDGETVTVLLRHDAAGMAFLFDGMAEVITVNFDRYAKDRRYRRETNASLYQANYRLVLSTDFLRHPKRDEALIDACAAEEAVAMSPRAWAKYDRDLEKNISLYARLFDSGPVHLDKVVRWSNFANWLTDTAEPPPLVQLPDASLPPAILSRPTVVLVPFSAVARKQSPPALFARLIAHWGAGVDVIIAGAPGELDKNPDYKPLLNQAHVRYDDSKFIDLAPVLKAAKLVISVDTAAMHLAVALGAPTLCLASAAYVSEIVPYAPEITPPNAHFIYTPMDCQGCLGDCIHPAEDGMFPCVARIETEPVLAKTDALLADGKPA